ncbi:putative RING-H2 finger protein ATL37 [Impatiens glandulifera]|uniref:putative RING-H2 finger protein ATL37 n=1 Tax=Impatiens glandulifera TaxID=253017 RepID=UPI001FB0D33D|nr:putative RING-H2 finger protein ATL37 [Impatiens glandulifera]
MATPPSLNFTKSIGSVRDNHSLIIICAVVGGVFLPLILAYFYNSYFRNTEILPPQPDRLDDDHIIESFAIVTFSQESQPEDSPGHRDCSVCCCDFETGEQIIIFPVCQHRHHAVCIREWFGQQTTCPICRHDYSGWRPDLEV